jgi:hypothetical protein
MKSLAVENDGTAAIGLVTIEAEDLGHDALPPAPHQMSEGTVFMAAAIIVMTMQLAGGDITPPTGMTAHGHLKGVQSLLIGLAVAFDLPGLL